MTTYKISTPVGVMARWLPSVDAAKAYYEARFAETKEEGDVLTFEVSSLDPDDGTPCPEHIDVCVNGSLDSCIWPESPEYPETFSHYGTPPDLEMISSRDDTECQHRRLSCGYASRRPYPDRCSSPRIRCLDCGDLWTPA